MSQQRTFNFISHDHHESIVPHFVVRIYWQQSINKRLFFEAIFLGCWSNWILSIWTNDENIGGKINFWRLIAFNAEKV